MVTVQSSLAVKSESGLSVYVVGPPLTVAVCVPEVAQEMVYHAPLTVTASLKVTVMLASTATPVALSAGEVEVTDGIASAETA